MGGVRTAGCEGRVASVGEGTVSGGGIVIWGWPVVHDGGTGSLLCYGWQLRGTG